MAIRNPLIKYKQLFINNSFVDAINGGTLEVINPATEETICHVSEALEADVNKAVKAAQAALQPGSEWREMDASERGRIMLKFCRLIARDTNYIASLETIDNGKPFTESLFDIEYTIKTLEFYAGCCDKIHGKTIPCDGGMICMTRMEPVGVVGQIIPWNYPSMMVAWKFGPALAAGCTVVLKPAELTPLSALYLGALAVEAGFPAGVINIVPGFGDTAGIAIAQHKDIEKVAFTGSTLVGRKVMMSAAESNLKRVTFELGGKSPIVVCEDCGDLDKAVSLCHSALFTNHGQNCCAATRTYVHESIYEEFVSKAKKMAEDRIVGDPFDEKTQQGPQISVAHMHRILHYINIGIKEGAKLECGGKRKEGDRGFYVLPTVFSGVNDYMRIAREEIFGPVQVILSYSSFKDVLQRCNNTIYGLASGIITKDINKAMTFAKIIKAGSVWVNCYDCCLPQTPFGGFKQSGQGRELGMDGLNEYLEGKTIIIEVASKL